MDIKLLMVLDDLYRTRSVTRTAEHFGTSQPSISMHLAKLRKHFNDPLFVKTRAGMEPTPHGREVARILGKASELFQLAVGHRVVFTPLTSNRIFRIAATDVGQAVILPKLMNQLREEAPGVSVDFWNISQQTPHQLESGEVDVAMGFINEMKTGFCRQKLFTDRFVCAARRDHPRIGAEITVKQFSQESILAVTTSGTGHDIVDRAMRRQGLRVRVGLRVPNFLGLSTLVASTDFITILPERLARIFARFGQLRILEVPFKLPPYKVIQYWHERYDRDPGHQWLRRVVAQLFCE
jgi:DNA-binding transcriptional LysR family regulator